MSLSIKNRNEDGVTVLELSGRLTIGESVLALRDTVQLFAVNENVTPTNVEKIRIKAASMVLVVDNNEPPLVRFDTGLVEA